MLKPNWDTEELIENWTLLPQELELLENKKVGVNKIGFALLLKHFQLFARFPDNNLSIPQVVISFVASQINLSENSYSDFDKKGRSARVYRAEIRRLFNFRIATVTDSEQMIDWLISEILPNERRLEAITEIVTRRWRELQLESPTTQRVERSIKSAIAKYEADFCSHTLSKLTPKAISQIDLLLTTDEAIEIENSESEKLHPGNLKASDFAILKTDPGAVGLDSFLTEIKKLKLIRTIGLPADLFDELKCL